MELSKNAQRIFSYIKGGYSRNEILSKNIVKPSMFTVMLSEIFDKTDETVKYHTAKNKYEELSCYCRNNPQAFRDIKTKIKDEDIKSSVHKKTTLNNNEVSVSPKIKTDTSFFSEENSKHNQLSIEVSETDTSSFLQNSDKPCIDIKSEHKHHCSCKNHPNIQQIIINLKKHYNEELQLIQAKLNVINDIEKEIGGK